MLIQLFCLGEFIIGRVIKAMMATWHPQCFCCEMCHKELADLGFIKNQGNNGMLCCISGGGSNWI